MKLLSALFSTTLFAAIAFSVDAKDDAYVYGKDPKKDAEYDISMGMAGIQQAAKDPKMLAQLFQDMQVRVTHYLDFFMLSFKPKLFNAFTADLLFSSRIDRI